MQQIKKLMQRDQAVSEVKMILIKELVHLKKRIITFRLCWLAH